MSNGSVVLVVAGDGYQHIEYGVTKKVIEGSGYKVVTASDVAGRAIGDDGSSIAVDVTLADINVKECSGLFFIGGSGALEHLDNESSHEIIKKILSYKKPLGAICIATRILAKAGVLTGRQATGWDGDGKLGFIYQENRVQYMNQNVVVDDNIITATGPDAAKEFGEQIILLLQDGKSWE